MTQHDETGLQGSAEDATSRRHGSDRRWRSILASGVLLVVASAYPAQSQVAQPERSGAASAPPSQSTLNQPGAEGRMLADQIGLWTVTETTWSKAGAAPVVTGNLIAERHLAGNLLEETLRSACDPAVLRRDFLTYDRVEGRWEYMSFDTRAAVGMMTAQSYGPEKDGKIELTFQPLALPGGSPTPSDASAPGQMVRLRQDVIQTGPDHIIKDQYFTLANGLGGEWLAHRYDAVRRR